MKRTSTRAWALLLGMVFVESFSTMMLKQSDGFQNLIPASLALSGYLLVLYLFSFVLAALPASLAYAVWTGLGTLLVLSASWLWFGEALTMTSLVAVGLIVCGVILINVQGKEKS